MSCTTFGNLGSSQCANVMKAGRRFIFVPEFDSGGTKNEFANVAAVTKSALQAKFDAASRFSRFYALPLVRNVDDKRADDLFTTWNDGSRQFEREGVRTINAIIPNEHPQFLDNLNSWRGQSFGIYIIDNSGNFVYLTDSATKLKVQPFLVEGKSFNARYVKALDGTGNQIMISFDLQESAKDELIRSIGYASLDFDALSGDLYSLLDVTTAASSISTTAVTLTETLTDYGNAVGGLLTGDLALYNVTDGAPVANATFAETGTDTGIYNVTFLAQTSSDVIRYTWTQARYSFTVGTFTIP